MNVYLYVVLFGGIICLIGGYGMEQKSIKRNVLIPLTVTLIGALIIFLVNIGITKYYDIDVTINDNVSNFTPYNFYSAGFKLDVVEYPSTINLDLLHTLPKAYLEISSNRAHAINDISIVSFDENGESSMNLSNIQYNEYGMPYISQVIDGKKYTTIATLYQDTTGFTSYESVLENENVEDGIEFDVSPDMDMDISKNIPISECNFKSTCYLGVYSYEDIKSNYDINENQHLFTYNVISIIPKEKFGKPVNYLLFNVYTKEKNYSEIFKLSNYNDSTLIGFFEKLDKKSTLSNSCSESKSNDMFDLCNFWNKEKLDYTYIDKYNEMMLRNIKQYRG